MDSLEKIIIGCKEEQHEAQKALFLLFSEKMLGLCLYYTSDMQEAEDILHDGFIRIFEQIGKYKETGNFEAWMRRVFINLALMRFRKKSKISKIEETPESSFVNKDNFTTIDVNIDDMMKMIMNLSPQYRMVFNLYAIEGYKHKEISKMLNISIGTSKSNLSRARMILQEQLKDFE
ncbi:MAG: RNA polymerase sigma factor [Saprospiraceae bacterium]|nr:RNA polymerase sigma factor [Saprospiraceae bacterium]